MSPKKKSKILKITIIKGWANYKGEYNSWIFKDETFSKYAMEQIGFQRATLTVYKPQ